MAFRVRLLLLAASFATSHAAGQTITEFTLPIENSRPFHIAAGPDGNLWFSEETQLRIGRITPTGVITEFPLTGSSFPAGEITAGSDGNLWFTIADFVNSSFSGIGRITPAGAVTIFPLPDPTSTPDAITEGPDGALWFTEVFGNRIGRITTAGAITEITLPLGRSLPTSIASGPDGNLWFTETGSNSIGRITPGGVVSEFSIPGGGQPLDIASGPDGQLWFAHSDGVGRITTAGIFTLLPGSTPASPLRIAPGPDGNVWFTEGDQVARITPTGAITRFEIPTPPSDAHGITPGPDDAVWFTEMTGNQIGRITTGIAADPTQVLPVVGSTPGVGGSFFRTSVQLHNAGTTPSAGGIVFHPSGTPGSIQDPTLFFTLAPGETRTIPDLLPAMGLSGLGSADVILTLGSAGNVPVVSARVFNDPGNAGTTGFAMDALTDDEALSAGRRGVLLIPADLSAFRLNVGVRTLLSNVELSLTVRNAAGAIATLVPKFFPAVYHEQQPASAFLNGFALPPGGSITVSVEAGSAIVYGATVDNVTGDPSLQIARAAP